MQKVEKIGVIEEKRYHASEKINATALIVHAWEQLKSLAGNVCAEKYVAKTRNLVCIT